MLKEPGELKKLIYHVFFIVQIYKYKFIMISKILIASIFTLAIITAYIHLQTPEDLSVPDFSNKIFAIKSVTSEGYLDGRIDNTPNPLITYRNPKEQRVLRLVN